MSKWESESLGIESKAQLKAYREHRFNALMQELQLGPVPTKWTAAEQAAEAAAWAQADAFYETLKVDLKTRLSVLPPDELALYFSEIGIPPQGIDIWLAASSIK